MGGGDDHAPAGGQRSSAAHAPGGVALKIDMNHEAHEEHEEGGAAVALSDREARFIDRALARSFVLFVLFVVPFLKMAPVAGLEPATFALQKRCSTN